MKRSMTPLRGPQYYWDRMREISKEQGSFSFKDIDRMTNGVGTEAIKRYVVGCERLGHVRRLTPKNAPGRKPVALFVVSADTRLAPAIPKQGDSAKKGLVNRQIWTAMRSLPTFRLRELQAAASTDTVPVQRDATVRYVRLLKNAGLVLVLENNGPHSAWLYRLKPSANTGPLPPKVLKTGVYDQNKSRLIPFEMEIAA